MGAFPLSITHKKNLLVCFQIAFLIVFRPEAIVVSSTRAPSPSVASASYTSGIHDEKWVLEEEFHGASSAKDGEHAKRTQHKKRIREGRPFPVQDEIEQSRTLGGHHDADSWWDDEESDECPIEISLQSTNKSHSRKGKHTWRPWKKRGSCTGSDNLSNNDLILEKSDSTLNASGSFPYEEHPMRTDEWELDIQLSPLFSKEEGELFPEFFADGSQKTKRTGAYRKRQVMQFARNGYVKVLQDKQFVSNNIDASFVASPATEQLRMSRVKVGKWRLGHSGITFDIPVKVFIQNHIPTDKQIQDNGPLNQRMTVLHYHADIHLNKFGERPRMFRGVITRDRYSSVLPSNFFRPVIGTFSAEGIGHDTVDTSYKDRGFGLSRHQVIQDRKFSEKNKP